MSIKAPWVALNDPKMLTRCVPARKNMTEIGSDAHKVNMRSKN